MQPTRRAHAARLVATNHQEDWIRLTLGVSTLTYIAWLIHAALASV